MVVAVGVIVPDRVTLVVEDAAAHRRVPSAVGEQGALGVAARVHRCQRGPVQREPGALPGAGVRQRGAAGMHLPGRGHGTGERAGQERLLLVGGAGEAA